jgi:hypothetical protein
MTNKFFYNQLYHDKLTIIQEFNIFVVVVIIIIIGKTAHFEP